MNRHNYRAHVGVSGTIRSADEVDKFRSCFPRWPCLMSLAAIKDEMRQREEHFVAQISSRLMIHGPNRPRRYATRGNISSRSLLSKLITKSHKFSLPRSLCLAGNSSKNVPLFDDVLSFRATLRPVRSRQKLSILMFVSVISTVRFLVLSLPMLWINDDHKS